MIALLLAAALAQPLPTPQHLPTLTVHAPKAELTLQIAKDEPQRERGLMSVTKLEPHTGMVFVFPQDGPEGFWMKDTLISLDMIFADKHGVVTDVFPEVPVVDPSTADDLIPRRNGTGMYVIELAAGESAKDGIRKGTHLDDLTALHTDQ